MSAVPVTVAPVGSDAWCAAIVADEGHLFGCRANLARSDVELAGALAFRFRQEGLTPDAAQAAAGRRVALLRAAMLEEVLTTDRWWRRRAVERAEDEQPVAAEEE